MSKIIRKSYWGIQLAIYSQKKQNIAKIDKERYLRVPSHYS